MSGYFDSSPGIITFQIIFPENCSSSLIGRTCYLGFYIDWFIELTTGAACVIIIAINGSIYVGIFLYINGMVKDLKMRLSSELSPVRPWSIYIKEINHHVEIIK